MIRALLVLVASFVAGLLLPLRVVNVRPIPYIVDVRVSGGNRVNFFSFYCHGNECEEIARNKMQGDIMEDTNIVSIDMTVEELESRIAPDGGETVLPLPTLIKHGHR